MKINETLRKLKGEIDKLSEEHDIDQLVKDYKATLEDIYVDYETPELNFESEFEADQEGEWLFDSKRESVAQAKILRDYRP